MRWLGIVGLVVGLGLACKKDEPAAKQEQPEKKDDAAPVVPDKDEVTEDAPKRGDGPGAGIADFSFHTDGPLDEDGSQPYEVAVRIHLDHTLGFVEAPVLEVGARSGGAEVKRSRVTEGEDLVYEHTIELPVAGRWSIDLYADGKYVRSLHAELHRLSCAGGRREWEFNGRDDHSGGAKPEAGTSGISAGINSYFSFSSGWEEGFLMDQPAAIVAEWVHDQKVVLRQQAEDRMSLEVLDDLGSSRLCSSEYGPEFPLEVPQDKMAAMVPGKWQLRVYSSSGEAVELSFAITGKEEETVNGQEEAWMSVPAKERKIPVPPAIAKQLAAKAAALANEPSFKARIAELRAVMRDRKAFDARVALNEAKKKGDPTAIASAEQALAKLVAEHGTKPLTKTSEVKMSAPKPLKADVSPPPTSGCDRSRCSSYPALSEDGKYIVYRTGMCLYAETGDGGQGDITRHYQLDDSKEVPSRDLSSYKPLECGKTGFKAVEKEGKHSLVGKGKKTIDLGEEPEKEVAAVCAHPKDKTLLVVWDKNMLEGLTGEPICVEGSSFQLVSY